jgi:DNA polymerase-1
MTYGFTADDLGDETAGKPMSARFLDYITLDAWSTVMIDRYLDERLAAIARPSSLPIWGQAAPQLLDYYRLIEQPLTPVLLAMSWRGVRIDAAQLQSAAPAMDARVNDLHAKICRLVGHPLNVNSHPQVYKLLYQELRYPEPKIRSRKTGLTKVNDEALKLLVKEACPRPGLETLPLDILEYRKWTHMKSTYITGLLARLLAGRLHSTFGQSGTATGRLNSTNPNLQNIPIRTPEGRQIRAAFIPSTGHAFIDADYAQIELRMHAWISQARTVLDPILAGQDLHCDTAAAIAAAAGLVPPATYDEVWAMTQTAKREFTERQRTLSLLRTVSKPINFGVIYGVTAPTLQTNLRTDAGIDLPEAQCEEFLETYFRRHPDVLAHNQRTLRDAGAYGFVASILGRKRAVFRVTGKRPDKHMVNAAYNTPIQASAQEIIKLKMIEYGNDPEFRKLGLHLLIQVHDELLMECPRENAEAAKAYIAATMPTVSFPLGVPMAADVHIGDDWEEAH